MAGLWLDGEVDNHVAIYGSKVAEGFSAFQCRSCIRWVINKWTNHGVLHSAGDLGILHGYIMDCWLIFITFRNISQFVIDVSIYGYIINTNSDYLTLLQLKKLGGPSAIVFNRIRIFPHFGAIKINRDDMHQAFFGLDTVIDTVIPDVLIFVITNPWLNVKEI